MITTNARAANLKIVVMAAGFSSRLGSPKALVRIHGRTLLRRTLSLATTVRADRIIVIVPPAAARYIHEARGKNITVCRNPDRGQGLSSSVRRGLKHARYSSAVLLLPVDLPHLKRHELHRLISGWRSSPSRAHATRWGGHGGAPAILPKRMFASAMDIEGDSGLRGLLAALPADQRVLIEIPSAHFDVDTRRQLETARHRWT